MRKIYFKILKRAGRRRVKRHVPYVIGVTGSIGKTTCRMIITDVLREMLPSLRISTSPKNFNTEIGLVLALLEIEKYDTNIVSLVFSLFVILSKALFGKKTYDVIVLEYGIDHPGDMDYLLSIVQPEMSVFTGLDKVHAAYFETIDDILLEKMKLMQHTKEITFIPMQAGYTDVYTQDMTIDILRYGLSDTEATDIGFVDHTLSIEDEKIFAEFDLDQEQERLMHIRTNLL